MLRLSEPNPLQDGCDDSMRGSMTPEDRSVLLRLIADAIYRHAKGDPDMLARRILEGIEAAEYEISKRARTQRDRDS
jgi:hypothetical protein